MIIFNISGGLGNQFFQYAFGRTLSLKHNVPLYLDFGSYDKDSSRFPKLDFFNTQYLALDSNKKHEYTKVYNSLHPYLKKHYRKDIFAKYKTYFTDKIELGYRPNLIKARKGYFDGYWGDFRYGSEILYKLQTELSLKREFCTQNFNELLAKIQNSNSVALHIRRGDYVHHPEYSRIMHTLPLDYYFNSIRLTSEISESQLEYFIFSDDINWAKENLANYPSFNFVENIETDVLEFELMKHCKNFITANSTFSLFAAWLSDSEQKIVVTPKKWYKDQRRQNHFENESYRPDNWYLV